MKKWLFALSVFGLSIVLSCRLPFINLPGEIAVTYDQGLYLFNPKCKWCTWRRITPEEIIVMWDVFWSPDGNFSAFHCTDGYVHFGWLYRPPNNIGVEFDPNTMSVRDGLCLLERDSEEIHWLIDKETDHNDQYLTIAWTLDSKYIVFESNDQNWKIVDPNTGEISNFHGGIKIQESDFWLLEVVIPPGAFKHTREPYSYINTNEFIYTKGIYSPDERYVLITFQAGESDPWQHYIYDTKRQRMTFLDESRFVHPQAWLPKR